MSGATFRCAVFVECAECRGTGSQGADPVGEFRCHVCSGSCHVPVFVSAEDYWTLLAGGSLEKSADGFRVVQRRAPLPVEGLLRPSDLAQGALRTDGEKLRP